MRLNLTPRPSARFNRCPTCEAIFNQRKPRQAYCSRLCSRRGTSHHRIAGAKAAAKYAPHIDKAGYVVVHDSASGKWVREHRLVMERHIGRRLLSAEVVHHVNEDRSDNRIENLVLCASQSDHKRDYHTPQLSHLHPKQCATCGEMFKPRTNRIRGGVPSVSTFCSRECWKGREKLEAAKEEVV